jgi:predicted dehydrogenase
MRQSIRQVQIAEMIAAIREGRAPATSGPVARKSLELVCAIYESARSRQEVILNSNS